MSAQELLSEIRKLPAEVRRQLILLAKGIIGDIPSLADYTDEDEDFEPIEVPGKPLSETIIEERR